MSEKYHIQMPDTAIGLLSERINRERPLLDQIWGPLFGSAFGFGMVLFVNLGLRRPFFAGIHRHFLSAAVFGYLGHMQYQRRADYCAERDAQYRHYIQLHPEDFVIPDPKKWGEVLDEWVPIR